MNAGEFGQQVEILELVELEPDNYSWQAVKKLWAKTEHQTARTIFTINTVMQRSTKFTIWALPELTLHHAIFVSDGNTHYYLADINKDTPGIYVLTALTVVPITCIAERTKTVTGDYNRPEVVKLPPVVFPGVLAEKYIRQTQEEPMSYTEARHILVTPKVITLDIGELVHIVGKPHEIVVFHGLDPYRNEYEILRRSDN